MKIEYQDTVFTSFQYFALHYFSSSELNRLAKSGVSICHNTELDINSIYYRNKLKKKLIYLASKGLIKIKDAVNSDG